MTKIHLLEAPVPVKDSVRAFEADVVDLLSRKADVVGLPGAGSNRHKALLRAARATGYQLVQPLLPENLFPELNGERASAPLLVKEGIEVQKEWYVHVVDPTATKDPVTKAPKKATGHGPRGLTCARIKTEGETVLVIQAHLLDEISQPDEELRFKQNGTFLKKAAAAVKREAKGKRVSFLLGDSNVPDGVLSALDLHSVWESRKRPEGPVCNILTWDADNRARTTRVRRWPLMKSDHAPFSMWVEVGDVPVPVPAHDQAEDSDMELAKVG